MPLFQPNLVVFINVLIFHVYSFITYITYANILHNITYTKLILQAILFFDDILLSVKTDPSILVNKC